MFMNNRAVVEDKDAVARTFLLRMLAAASFLLTPWRI
jgi:hypothetical protein